MQKTAKSIKSVNSGKSTGLLIDGVMASMHVYRAYLDIYKSLYGKDSLPHITMANYFSIETITNDHSVTDYDELLRIR